MPQKRDHLSNLSLADPDFGIPGKIDLLLGADVYTDVLLHGRRCGPPGTPTAFETQFGWVLTGRTNMHSASHPSVISGDDILRMFWEIEEGPKEYLNLSTEGRSVVQHFKENHSRSKPADSLSLNQGTLKANHLVNQGLRPLGDSFHSNVHSTPRDNSKNFQL